MIRIKYQKRHIITSIIFLGIIVGLLLSYDNNIKDPILNPSPSPSGKIIYLFLSFLDKYLGKLGVFTFFGICFFYFLYRGIIRNDNKN